MAELFDIGIFSVEDTDGSVGAGWKLNFYVTGTSTRQDTYPTEADADAGTNANTNPVVADAAGRFASIWLKTTGDAYKAVLTTAADVVKATKDPAMFSVTRALASTASGKGDALAGRRSIVKATAFLTTTSDLLNGAPVNVFANIPRAQHAAILDGTSTYDAQSDIQELIDACGTTGATLTFPPCGTVWVDGKLSITSKNSITFQGTGNRYMAGAALRMLATSTDDCLWDLSQSNDVVWRNLGMFGRSSSEASTYLIKAEDDNGDVDVAVIDCHAGNMRTLAQIKGRGFLLQGSSVVSVTHGIEIDWPADVDFVSLGNTDHYIGSAMRTYRVVGNRFHSWSGGHIIINTGAKAHYIRAVEIAGNYADTNLRIWNGHITGARIVNNTVIHTAGGNLALFDIPADLNTFGGVINQDVLIQGNIFAGQLDDTYESGGNPSVQERSILSIGTFRNTSGLKIIANTFNRIARDTLEFTGTTQDITICDNTFRDVSLDAMRTLVLTGTTGVFTAGETITGGTSGATATLVYDTVATMRLKSVTGTFQAAETVTGGTSGATATVSTTTAPASRWPIDLGGATVTRGLIEGNHVVGDSDPGGSLPVVNVTGATVTDLRIGETFYDTAKWKLDNHNPAEHTSIADDAVLAFPLKKGAGSITVQMLSGTTMIPCIVAYKLQGSNSAGIVSDPSSSYTVDVTDTVPTGTTGTDTTANLFFVESSGVKTLYVENRLGGARPTWVIQ